MSAEMFERFLAPHAERAYALLRIFAGTLFSLHGMQKTLGVLGRDAAPLGTQAWVGGVIELVSGILIALGAFTSCAAFVASGTMAVAYTQFHWKGALGERFFPVVNGGELAVIYAWLFFFIACRGAGIWSVDSARRRR
jgi:putative oxidoreductase